ncbi:hypothetical protein AAFF_G00078790 [Aldrovandia affinis]|uniref:Uncharacterized protein n=1 Tax=Aldrovandia affinis TaxID=143900 RepID=A0AAD7RXN9_9TELE|nr:hypothetical protein AAFF_G00078790 [Aldrovandia affinis]
MLRGASQNAQRATGFKVRRASPPVLPRPSTRSFHSLPHGCNLPSPGQLLSLYLSPPPVPPHLSVHTPVMCSFHFLLPPSTRDPSDPPGESPNRLLSHIGIDLRGSAPVRRDRYVIPSVTRLR